MRLIASYLSLLIMLLHVTSCSFPVKLVFCNNTGMNIVVTSSVASGSESFEIMSKETREVRFPGSSYRLTVVADSISWTYDVHYPPGEFIEPGSHRKIKVQLESDGRIYVFVPSIDLPSDKLFPQPEGFPWNPIR